MLDKYLIENYDKLKDIAHNIAGVKEKDDFFNAKKYDFSNWYHSKTSRYYYKYKKYYEYHVTTTIESLSHDKSKDNTKKKEIIEERLEWVEEKLKDLYWFDAECFRIYYRENFTFTEMAKATKISRGTLYKAIKNVKNYLINER